MKTSGGWVRDGNAVADEGAEGWEMRFTGPFAGEGIRRGFLKVFQYCCSGVRRVDGSAGSLTCWRGRTGAAMLLGIGGVGLETLSRGDRSRINMRLGCRYIAPSPRSANTEKLMSGRNLKLSRKVLSGIPNRVSAFGFLRQ